MVRAVWQGPFSLKDPALNSLFGYGARSSAGIAVTERGALTYAPVWAAVNLIGNDVAKLPLVLYKRLADGRGKERFPGHPLYRMLHDAPNPNTTSFILRRTMQAQALLWSNAYAEIVRDGAGRPRELWVLHPDAVTAEVQSGVLRYRVRNPSAADTIFDAGDILHIRGLGLDDYGGVPLIQMARNAIGMGLAAEEFGASFYANGARMSGVFTHPSRRDPQKEKNFREGVNAQQEGSARAHNFMVVQEGMTYTQLGIRPDEAQFLESRGKYSIRK
jgi:HK97 family phage portal protein